MLSFKEYLNETQNKPNNVGFWDNQSFSEVDPVERDRPNSEQSNNNVGFWDNQSFSEVDPLERKQISSGIPPTPNCISENEQLNEKETPITVISKPRIKKIFGALKDSVPNSNLPNQTKLNRNGERINNIFYHPDVLPTKLVNRRAVIDYTGIASNHKNGYGSSKNMNAFLKNAHGYDGPNEVQHHTPDKVYGGIQNLLSNYTLENTVRTELHTFSGVPDHIGKRIQNGEIGSLGAFTSTSTLPNIARTFAHGYRNYADEDSDNAKPLHIVHFRISKGGSPNALGVAHESDYGGEHEVLLRPGTHIKYSHSELVHQPVFDINGKPKLNAKGKHIHRKYLIHHVDVLNTHDELPPLTAYRHPTQTPKQDALTQALTGKIKK